MTRCKNHPPRMDGFNGTAQCQECGSLIYNGLTLCERCSKYLDQCEICADAADTDINPALVAAFNTPQAAAARTLCKRGHMLQTQTYRQALSQTYQGLIAEYSEKVEAATKELRAKLTTDLAADPAYKRRKPK